MTRSGFLQNYDSLERDPDERARESYVREEVDWSAYDSVIFEPLAIRLQESSLDDVDPGQVETLREHYNEYLLASLGESLEVVEEPGPTTLRVRSALTEVDTISLVANWFLAIAVIWPLDVGGATLEVEVVDAESGEQLAAIVNADKGTLWNGIQAMIRIGHACQAIEETAQWIGETTTPAQASTEFAGNPR